MNGFITTRHLVTHAPLIVGQFGWRAYLRCVGKCIVARGQPTTFLGAVFASGSVARGNARRVAPSKG